MSRAVHVDGNAESRRSRALASLEGLSVGDAFGERFFVHPALVESLIESRALPGGRWHYTDDTEMALAIVEVLESHGIVDREALAQTFARRYVRQPLRGYGSGAHMVLTAIANGAPWREASRQLFNGQGSMGNGGAMRAAPVGAWYADDIEAAIANGRASAEVTHAHPDGQSGAIAVALASAWAARRAAKPGEAGDGGLLAFVQERLPTGPTHDGIARAMEIDSSAAPWAVAEILGSGGNVLSSDTVPFALWCAARHADSYEEALWATVSGLGDRDTTCAIVGGIVASGVGVERIPAVWRDAREPLVRTSI